MGREEAIYLAIILCGLQPGDEPDNSMTMIIIKARQADHLMLAMLTLWNRMIREDHGSFLAFLEELFSLLNATRLDSLADLASHL